MLFSPCFWKGHWLGGVLSSQKLRLFPLPDLPGAAFGEAGGQVRGGGRLPGAVSADEGLQPSWGRAVRCLTRFVTGWKWPLTGHVAAAAAASSVKCHRCLAFMGLISQLLHPSGQKAKCLWPDYHPLLCKLCWHFSLAPRACKTLILEKTHECEVFKRARVKLIQLLTYMQKGVQESPVWFCASVGVRTWSRFYLAVFTQALQLLSLFTVLPCWAIRLGAVQEKPLCSSSCVIGAGNSKANLSCGNSQVLFLFFSMGGEHVLSSYTPFLCTCTAGAAGGEVWAMVVLERRMWRKNKSNCILRIDLTGEVPPAFQEEKRLM